MNDFIRNKINEFNEKNNEKIACINDNSSDYAVLLLDRYEKDGKTNSAGFAVSSGEDRLRFYAFHLAGEEWSMTEEIHTDEPDDEEFGLEKKLEDDFDTITSDWASYLRGNEEATELGERINEVISYLGDKDTTFVSRRINAIIRKIKETETAFLKDKKLAELNNERRNYYYLILGNFLFNLDSNDKSSFITEDILNSVQPYVQGIYRTIFETYYSEEKVMLDIGDLVEITEVGIDDETAEIGFNSIYKKGTPNQLAELLCLKNNVKIRNENVKKWIEMWNAISGGNPDSVIKIYTGFDEDEISEGDRILANGDNLLKLNTLEFIRSEMLDEKDAELRARMAKDMISISMDSNGPYVPKSDIIDLVYDSLVDADIEHTLFFYEFTDTEPSNPETRKKMYEYIERH